MPWQQTVYSMLGSPIGISFYNGQGTSGVLCSVQEEVLYVIEYMYQDQFALKQYPFDMIEDVNTFPACQYGPRLVY